MTTMHTDTAQKTSIQCSYDTTYYSMYQPSYDMIFIFYDEEECEDSDWGDFVIPPSHDSGIQH